MPVPEFLREIRARFGKGLVLMPAVCAVVRDDAANVLVMRRADTGDWSLPSGICEPDEPPAKTLVRELWEEAGLRCIPQRVLATFHTPPLDYPNGDVACYVSTLFEASVVGGALEARDGEALELKFVALEEVPAMRLRDWLPGSLAALLAAPRPPFAFEPGWLDELG